MKSAIAQLVKGQDLSGEMMQDCMRRMMSGQANEAEIAAFLTALTIKGETVEEVSAAAQVMRELALAVALPDKEAVIVDPVGTGGDGASLFNVSTAASIIASAAGVKIAKHGNIAASSASGSADVLRQAGVELTLSAQAVAEMIEECGFGFMFAQAFHSAMRHVAPVRRALGIRTVFNVLGPLSNPASVKYHLFGVFSRAWLMPMAEVAKNLGAKKVLVVHSDNGLDEFSITHPNTYVEMQADGSLLEMRLDPLELEMRYNDHHALQVQDSAQSLALIEAIFDGGGPAIGLDMLALNAAAIFKVAGLCENWQDGIVLAKDTIRTGKAKAQLARIARFSQGIRR